MKQRCGRCHMRLPSGDFAPNGNDNWCKHCHRDYYHERRAKQALDQSDGTELPENYFTDRAPLPAWLKGVA